MSVSYATDCQCLQWDWLSVSSVTGCKCHLVAVSIAVAVSIVVAVSMGVAVSMAVAVSMVIAVSIMVALSCDCLCPFSWQTGMPPGGRAMARTRRPW